MFGTHHRARAIVDGVGARRGILGLVVFSTSAPIYSASITIPEDSHGTYFYLVKMD